MNRGSQPALAVLEEMDGAAQHLALILLSLSWEALSAEREPLLLMVLSLDERVSPLRLLLSGEATFSDFRLFS